MSPEELCFRYRNGNGNGKKLLMLQPDEFVSLAQKHSAGEPIDMETVGRALATIAFLGRQLQEAQEQVKQVQTMATALAGLAVMVSTGMPVPAQRQHGIKSVLVPKAVVQQMDQKHGVLDVVEVTRAYRITWKEPAKLIHLSRVPNDRDDNNTPRA